MLGSVGKSPMASFAGASAGGVDTAGAGGVDTAGAGGVDTAGAGGVDTAGTASGLVDRASPVTMLA